MPSFTAISSDTHLERRAISGGRGVSKVQQLGDGEGLVAGKRHAFEVSALQRAQQVVDGVVVAVHFGKRAPVGGRGEHAQEVEENLGGRRDGVESPSRLGQRRAAAAVQQQRRLEGATVRGVERPKRRDIRPGDGHARARVRFVGRRAPREIGSHDGRIGLRHGADASAGTIDAGRRSPIVEEEDGVQVVVAHSGAEKAQPQIDQRVHVDSRRALGRVHVLLHESGADVAEDLPDAALRGHL
ncbi:3-ketoacyl-ACP reductase [Babesia caballi]|uniref:3-ketoacyl-ACP reductase n=1 Tax=Babesia caballi TaxID=5871 RepID=A0AAV4M141_BABCB|nr:3-ketoacyl-ACP reductase [Babesia caballi]